MRELAESIASSPLSRNVVLLTLLALLLPITQGGAQSLPAVRYRAPAGCPAQAVFEQRVRERVGPNELAGAAWLAVRLQLRKGRAVGVITLRDAGATLASREIEAATCAEALEAVAFVAALLLEQHAADQRAAPSPSSAVALPQGPQGRVTRPTGASPSGARSEPRADLGQAPVRPSPDGSRAEEHSLATPARPAPARTTEERPTPERSQTTPTAHAESPSAAVEVASPSVPHSRAPVRASTVRVRLSAAALLASGVAPQPRPGLAVMAGLARAVGEMEGALLVGLRGTLPQRERDAAGTARFTWWSAVAALCAGSPSAAAVSLEACALGESGQLSGHGERTLSPRTKRAPWIAVGPSAQLAWRLLPRLWLAAGAELLVPLRDDRFEIAATTLHEVPRLTYRAALAVRVHLP